jgi:hypothetical protein
MGSYSSGSKTLITILLRGFINMCNAAEDEILLIPLIRCGWPCL